MVIELKDDPETLNFIECKLYLLTNNEKIEFNFLNQCISNYYEDYKDIFNELNEFSKKYIVTLDGTKESQTVIWI